MWRAVLVTTHDLKTLLNSNLKRQDKLLLILASNDAPCQVKKMKGLAKEAGFRVPPSWNVSSSLSLSRSRGFAIRTPTGWEITDAGKQHLRDLGVTKISPGALQVATDLRVELPNIKDIETRSFVDEAIKCYEAGLYRSAIVMSWIGAVSVLHDHVHARYLSAFNAEAKRVDSRWKKAMTKDDLGRMKEVDFLDRIEVLSIIGRDVKKELKYCLDRRNSCGHPNSLQVRANMAAHHLEVLLLNVYKKY